MDPEALEQKGAPMGNEVAKVDGKVAVKLDDLSDTYLLWREKSSRLAELEQEVAKLRATLEDRIGTAEVALIMDEPVITYAYVDKLKETQLKKDNPDLHREFLVPKVVDVFDKDAFRKKHPNLFQRYRSRQFRVVDK